MSALLDRHGRLTGVVISLCPGRRLLSCTWMSSLVSVRPGGHPSTMQPTLLQWLSPYVVTRNSFPKVDMVVSVCGDV